MKTFRLLLLSEREIKPLLRMGEVFEAVEEAFKERAKGHTQMPPKLYLYYSKYCGDLRTMPSYLEGSEISAVKIVNVHPNNPSRFKLPTVMATITLIDPKTGAPLAIMGGSQITAMRTGAAGGVAAKYLARKNSKTIGLVGAGIQAKTQLQALIHLYKTLGEVRVWSRTTICRDKFVEQVRSETNGELSITSVEKVKEAVVGADIIVTTTPSKEPLVKMEWISPGTHINCIGADAPGKEELDPAVLKRAKIVVDCWEQASHSGEINIPVSKGQFTKDDIWAEIGEVVTGTKKGRETSSELTIFVSTGLAIQDAVTANLVYQKAKKKRIGQTIKI